MSENEGSFEVQLPETTVVGCTTTTSRLRKGPLTQVNSSKTAKRQLQSSNNDELPETEESSEDESSESETTNFGSPTSSRVRKSPLTLISATNTVQRQLQSSPKATKTKKTTETSTQNKTPSVTVKKN